MVATTDIRWQVALRLVDLARANPDLADVQIEPGWPGDLQQAESIWVAGISSDENFPYMVGPGRQVVDVTFDIPFLIEVKNRSDWDATTARLGELITALRDVPQNDPSLGQLEGLKTARHISTEGSVGRTPEGWSAMCKSTIQATARIF